MTTTLSLSRHAQELLQDTSENALYRAALSHPAIFLDVFGMLSDPNTGPQRFLLWDWQWEFLSYLTMHKRIVILKARQLGISWMLSGYALWKALSNPGSRIMFVSRKESTASDLVEKCSFIYRYLPSMLRVPTSKKDRDNDIELTFGLLDSTIWAEASTKGSGRSKTANVVIPDEWAYHPDDAEMYTSYEPTLGVLGQIVGCSTANGRRGLFYNLYSAAKRKDNDYFPLFLPWHLRPDYTKEFRDSKARDYEMAGEAWKIHQEFPEDDITAFGGSGKTYFAREGLERLATSIDKPKRVDWEGTLHIWKEPAYGMRYVIGCDVAEGGQHGNRSAAIVLEPRTGRHAATLVGHWEPYVYAELLVKLAKLYHDAVLAVENNNHGLAVLEALSKVWQYPHLYETHNRRGERKLGWNTNVASRSVACEDIRAAIADESWFSQDEEWLEEAYQFTEDQWGRPSAAPGAKDDLVMASAIAWQARTTYGVIRRAYRTTPLSR